MAGKGCCLTARFCMYAQVDAERTIDPQQCAAASGQGRSESRHPVCRDVLCAISVLGNLCGRAHAHVIHGYTVAGQSEIIESSGMYSADVHRSRAPARLPVFRRRHCRREGASVCLQGWRLNMDGCYPWPLLTMLAGQGVRVLLLAGANPNFSTPSQVRALA